MNHAIPNNDNFNSTSMLGWLKGDFSDYLSIQISELKHAIWTPVLLMKYMYWLKFIFVFARIISVEVVQ